MPVVSRSILAFLTAVAIVKAMRNEQSRDKMVGFKVSIAEYQQLREAAFKARKSISAYVRERILPKSK